jgi:hypothetical protein
MSTVRHQVRLPRRAIFIALITTLALVAALVPAGAGAGTKPNAHHLVFRLSGAAHQDVVDSGAVKVRVRCPAEACTVVASATAKSPSVHSSTVRAHVPAGGTEDLTLTVSAHQGAKLEAARKAGKAPTLTVHATAKDGAGNAIPLTFVVRVTKS